MCFYTALHILDFVTLGVAVFDLLELKANYFKILSFYIYSTFQLINIFIIYVK